MKVEFRTSRDSLPQEFWKLMKGITYIDPEIIFADSNLNITVEQDDNILDLRDEGLQREGEPPKEPND